MMDKFSQQNNDNDFPGSLLEQFGEKDRDTVLQIWNRLQEAKLSEPDVSSEESEEALANLNRRLDQYNASDRKRNSSQTHSTYDRIITLKWLAAAAVLITIGAGWLWLPKTVTIPHGQIAAVTLPDGSKIELNSGSVLQYSRLFSYTNRTVRLNGEAWFDVVQGDHPFVVESDGAEVRVTGTTFNVRSWRDDPDSVTEVTVSSGEVELYPANDPERRVTLMPEQMSRWSAGMAQPSLPEQVDLDQILGWRELRLIFDNKPLQNIFRELERRYDVHIELDDPSLRHETLTAFYVDPGGVESVLHDICTVKGLRYTTTANGFRVYRPGPQ